MLWELFFSISSLAEAVGPLILRSIYYWTNSMHSSLYGLDHGIMFIFASIVYVLVILFAIALPAKKANSRIDKLTAFFNRKKAAKRNDDGDNTTVNDGSDFFEENNVGE